MCIYYYTLFELIHFINYYTTISFLLCFIEFPTRNLIKLNPLLFKRSGDQKSEELIVKLFVFFLTDYEIIIIRYFWFHKFFFLPKWLIDNTDHFKLTLGRICNHKFCDISNFLNFMKSYNGSLLFR